MATSEAEHSSSSRLAELRSSAKGWHGVQLAALGFIGLCGVIKPEGSSSPETVQSLSGTLILVAFVAACLGIYHVGKAAWPIYGATPAPLADADQSAVDVASAQLKRGLVLARSCRSRSSRSRRRRPGFRRTRRDRARPSRSRQRAASRWCGELAESTQNASPEAAHGVAASRCAAGPGRERAAGSTPANSSGAKSSSSATARIRRGGRGPNRAGFSHAIIFLVAPLTRRRLLGIRLRPRPRRRRAARCEPALARRRPRPSRRTTTWPAWTRRGDRRDRDRPRRPRGLSRGRGRPRGQRLRPARARARLRLRQDEQLPGRAHAARVDDRRGRARDRARARRDVRRVVLQRPHPRPDAARDRGRPPAHPLLQRRQPPAHDALPRHPPRDRRRRPRARRGRGRPRRARRSTSSTRRRSACTSTTATCARSPSTSPRASTARSSSTRKTRASRPTSSSWS